MSKPKIKSQSGAAYNAEHGGKPIRIAKTKGTVQMLEPTVAPSGKAADRLHLPQGALLAPSMDAPHEKWPEQLRQHYEQALKQAEGAKLYQHAGVIGQGHEHKPVVDMLQREGGLSPEEALDLARYRQHTMGIAPRTGPTQPLDTPEDVMNRAAAMRAAKTPEERLRIEREAKAREDMLRQEHYFDELVGPKKRAIYEQKQREQQMQPVGPPVSQAEQPSPETEVG